MKRLLLIIGLLCGASGLGAQPTPPLITVQGDPKHWESWFDHGVRVMRESPREAAAAFAWASRLDPTRGDPSFALYAASMLMLPRERTVQYFRGEEVAMRDPAVLAADSARTIGLVRNPIVHRGLEAVMFDVLPGGFRDDRDTRAWVAYSNGELQQAITLYTRTIDRLGARARWQLFDRALAYAAAGNSRAALLDLRTLLAAVRADEDRGAVTFYRSKHFLLYMIGTLQMRLNDLAGAQVSFSEALVEDASFAYAHAAIAQVARAQQRYADAVDALTLAIELAPGDAVLHQSRGASLLSQARLADAAADFERAAALQPLWPAPVLAMAQVAERQRKEAEARALYLSFLQMAPADDPAARTVRQRLGITAP